MLVAVAATISSCCSCRKPATRPPMASITASQWQLVQMDGVTVKPTGDSFTLAFAENNMVSGKGDCNRLTGSFKNNGADGTLSFGTLASSRMFCPDQAAEDKFLRLLNEIDGYSIDGSMLMLMSNGKLSMIFEKAGK